MSDSYKGTWEKVWIENLYLIISFSPSPSRKLKWCRNWYLLASNLFPGQCRASSLPCRVGWHAVWHPCPTCCSLAPSCKDEKLIPGHLIEILSWSVHRHAGTSLLLTGTFIQGESSMLCSKKLQEGEWIYCFHLHSVAWDLTVALAVLD